jgi:hypothetical protein
MNPPLVQISNDRPSLLVGTVLALLVVGLTTACGDDTGTEVGSNDTSCTAGTGVVLVLITGIPGLTRRAAPRLLLSDTVEAPSQC